MNRMSSSFIFSLNERKKYLKRTKEKDGGRRKRGGKGERKEVEEKKRWKGAGRTSSIAPINNIFYYLNYKS